MLRSLVKGSNFSSLVVDYCVMNLANRYNLVKGIECILKEQSLTPTLV